MRRDGGMSITPLVSSTANRGREICETEGRQMATGDIHKSMFLTSMVTDLLATAVAGLVPFKLLWGLAGSQKLQGSGRNPREVDLAAKVMSPGEGVTPRVRPGHQHKPNTRKPSPANSKT